MFSSSQVTIDTPDTDPGKVTSQESYTLTSASSTLADSGSLADGTFSAGGVAIANIGNVVIQAGSSVAIASPDQEGNLYGSADSFVGWTDTINLTSSTLPIGTPVEFKLSNKFSSFQASLSEYPSPNVDMGLKMNAFVEGVTGLPAYPTSSYTYIANGGQDPAETQIVEILTTYNSPVLINATIGNTITVGENFQAGAYCQAGANQSDNPIVDPISAFTGYPFYFIPVSTGAATIPGELLTHDLVANSVPDVSLIDATGHNWLTPVPGIPTDLTTLNNDFAASSSFNGASPAPEVPETGTLSLMALGLGGLLLKARKRRARAIQNDIDEQGDSEA